MPSVMTIRTLVMVLNQPLFKMAHVRMFESILHCLAQSHPIDDGGCTNRLAIITSRLVRQASKKPAFASMQDFRPLRRMDIPLTFEQAGGLDSLDLGLIAVANSIGKGH
jgi:hypothetical protein